MSNDRPVTADCRAEVTAETITDAQIRELRELHHDPGYMTINKECDLALHDQPNAADYPTSTRRQLARSHCAAALNGLRRFDELVAATRGYRAGEG